MSADQQVRELSPVVFFVDPDLMIAIGSSNTGNDTARTIPAVSFMLPRQSVEIAVVTPAELGDESATDESPKDVTPPVIPNASSSHPSSLENSDIPVDVDSEKKSEKTTTVQDTSNILITL